MIFKFEDFNRESLKLKEKMLFLFHGSNQGKLDDCANLMIDLKKEEMDIEVIRLYSEELKKGELTKVFNENCSLNIFGTQVVLNLYINSEKIGKELISLISNIETSNLIVIIKSDQLPPKSLIRSFFEKSENAICVPCYEESYNEKLIFVKNYLKKEMVEFSISELNILSNSLPNERLEIKSELEKIIILFKKFGREHSFDFFLSHISESIHNDQSKFILSLSSKNSKDFIKDFNSFTNFGADNIKLVSYLLEHFFRLLTVKNRLKEGHDIKNAVQKLKPPVFFKDKVIFEKQVLELTFDEINKMIKNLYHCKKNLINGNWSSSFSLLCVLLGFLRSDIK